jgi:thiosulfate reductase cytochrome b subunit
MNAEGNVVKVQEALAWLSSTTQLPQLTIRLPPLQSRSDLVPVPSQIIKAEKDLVDSIDDLVKHKQYWNIKLTSVSF